MCHSADKTEDISLGHSISDSSERIAQRCKGGVGQSQDIAEFLQQTLGVRGLPW